MPKITQITIQSNKKDRCNIFVDGEFRIGLSIETVMRRRLKTGMEITDKELSEIAFDGEKEEALAKALNYVSKNLKTKKQVKTYLYGKGYSECVVYYVIDKLKEYDYINDEEYARRYLESCSDNQGKRLSEYKLMMKGIKKEDIANAYGGIKIPAKENAAKVAEKHIRNKEKNKENLAKTYRYLIGRGFSYEEAEYAISKIKEIED